MQIAETRDGAVLTLRPSGRIDHATVDAFHEALAPYLTGCTSGGHSIALDFSDISYVSSVGLRALLIASKKIAAQDGRIVIAAMQPTVGEVFRISRFDTIMPSFDSVDAAVEALKA